MFWQNKSPSTLREGAFALWLSRLLCGYRDGELTDQQKELSRRITTIIIKFYTAYSQVWG